MPKEVALICAQVIIDSSDFLAAYQKGEADPVRQIEMEEAVAALVERFDIEPFSDFSAK